MNAQSPGARPASRDFGPGVRLEAYAPGHGLPMFIHAEDAALSGDVDAAVAWIHAMKDRLDDLATDVGAVVLRGFALPDTFAFGRAVEKYPNMEFGYSAGATPRETVQGRVFEATRSPPAAKLPLHQEMSYLPQFPTRVAFYCAIAAETGGETIIADVRRFERLLPASLRNSVERRGVRYIRNFRAPDWSTGNAELDMTHRPWTEAFGATDPTAAEAQCRAMGIEFEWTTNGSMTVITNTPGVTTHPRTGQTIWFNQMPGMTINEQSWGQRRNALVEAHYGPNDVRPYEISYGDGGPVPAEELAPVYGISSSVEVGFPWKHGDLLFLDNIYTFHGRNPYTGERDVQVALLG